MKRISLPALTVLLICGIHSLAAPAALRIIATNGTAVGDARLTSIRPGVSINNRGTIAFAAALSDGRGTLLAMTPDGQLKELRHGDGVALLRRCTAEHFTGFLTIKVEISSPTSGENYEEHSECQTQYRL